ncbi:MAG: prolyl oligopeptidase family serine peptidase, partial [Bacteroidales bacterium]|nr:prolyl oligopeptidase family serine peptidase [Bacteroidales bacterium]
MSKALPKFLRTLAIVAGCSVIGYGCGWFYKNVMKKGANEGGQYIGQSDIKIADGVMTPETLLAFGRLSDPQLSPDGKKILYGVSYTSIAENRSCRNLFICNLDGSDKVQLTMSPKSISNARWSLDGQMYKAPYASGKLGIGQKLSEVPSGIGEFKLSPDQNSVLYISTIKNPDLVQPADTDPALDKAQAYVTENLMYRHWDHWVTERPRTYLANFNALVTPETSVDLLGDEPWELPTEPFGGAEQLTWAPDGRHIAYSCRKHLGKEYAFSTNCGIFVYDIVTGQTVTVKGDGGYDTDPVWSPDGTKLAWISMARDGYEADAQRILISDVTVSEEAEGQSFGMSFSEPRQVATALDRDASGLIWTDDSETIVFAALIDGIESIFRVDAAEGSQAVRLTPAEWPYDFASPFAVSKDGSNYHMFATNTCLNRPAEIVEVISTEGEDIWNQITTENEHILKQLKEPTSESVWLETVDGKQMHCWVLYPPEFDATKQYPAVEIVLGGPQGTNSQGWSYRWNYRLMAQQGYIVIMPNRRGTTAFGQEWKEQISGDYSGLNMQDYLVAGRYIKSQPYVSKLACTGASYGGYSAYMLEGLHGDLFDCFVAHAGIFSEKQMWYTTEESWFANWDGGGLTEYAYEPGQMGPKGDGITFGGMQQAGAPYASTAKAQHHYASDPSCNVTKWHTPILCIHGMMDFRIP